MFKEGPLSGRRIEVQAELVLGREDAGLTIEDEEISRRHAVVRLREGGLEIEDLGSTNGTYVNGARIEGPTRLGGGDTVKLGRSLLEVEPTRAAATAAAAVPPPPPPRSAPTPCRPSSAAAGSRAGSSGRSSSRSRSSPRPRRRSCSISPTADLTRAEVDDHGERDQHEEPDRRASCLPLRVDVQQLEEVGRAWACSECGRGDVVRLRLGRRERGCDL